MRSLLKKLKLAGMVIGILGAFVGCDSSTSTTPPGYTQPQVCNSPILRAYNNSGEAVELNIYDGAFLVKQKFLASYDYSYDFTFPMQKSYHVIVKAQVDGYLLVDSYVSVVNDICNKQYSLTIPKAKAPVITKDASFIVTNYTSEHLALYINTAFQEVIAPGKAVKYTNYPDTYNIEVRQEHYNNLGDPIHQITLYNKAVKLITGTVLPIDIIAIDPEIKIYNDTDLSGYPGPNGEGVFAFFNSLKQIFDSGFNDVLAGGVETFSIKHYNGIDYLKVNGAMTNTLYNDISLHFEENVVYEYHAQ